MLSFLAPQGHQRAHPLTEIEVAALKQSLIELTPLASAIKDALNKADKIEKKYKALILSSMENDDDHFWHPSEAEKAEVKKEVDKYKDQAKAFQDQLNKILDEHFFRLQTCRVSEDCNVNFIRNYVFCRNKIAEFSFIVGGDTLSLSTLVTNCKDYLNKKKEKCDNVFSSDHLYIHDDEEEIEYINHMIARLLDLPRSQNFPELLNQHLDRSPVPLNEVYVWLLKLQAYLNSSPSDALGRPLLNEERIAAVNQNIMLLLVKLEERYIANGWPRLSLRAVVNNIISAEESALLGLDVVAAPIHDARAEAHPPAIAGDVAHAPAAEAVGSARPGL